MKVVRKDTQFGRQTVGTRRPSTGIYGKHAGGQVPNNAVRVRKGGR